MQSSGRIKVADLNDLLTCELCNGYYIDATTIIECLHSFCKTCIVTYLQTNKYCPKCEVQVHKTRPLLNIRSDQTLQDIVYKVVPGLFKNEMKRRREFYSQENALVQGSIPSSSEKRGDVWGCDRLIFTPEDIISVSLEYCPLNLPLPLNLPTFIYSPQSLDSNSGEQDQTRRYLRCPAAITVYHLKKFLRAKYGLNQNKKLEVLYMHDILKDQYTLIDLAYIYSWKRNGPLRLFYKIADETSNLVPKMVSQPLEKVEGVSLEVNVTDPVVASASSSVALLSTDAPMATAPSSRHPSPPPSPQMAAEPNYVKIDKPNSAALLNEQASKVQEIVTRKSSLKSSLSASKVENMLKYKPYVALPILRNTDAYTRHKLYEDNISPDSAGIELSQKNKGSEVPKKKTVTFSVDLVQTFYGNPSYKASKHTGKSSIFRTTKMNRSTVINMRNGILTGKRS